MDQAELTRVVEALVFASSEPVVPARLEALLEPDGVSREEIRQALQTLQMAYAGRGVELREVASGYQLRTCPDLAPWLARMESQRPVRFSRAALETLSIVAYRQPVTRAEIEEVRGVDCGGVAKSLLEKGLVRIVGKKDVPGRPLLYGTSRKFLEVFGLESLSALPSLREIQEILDEQGEDIEGPGGGAQLEIVSLMPGAKPTPEAAAPMDTEEEDERDGE